MRSPSRSSASRETAAVAESTVPTAHEASVWRTPDGRVRPGWRLLQFGVVALVVQQLTQPLVPNALPWSTAPILLGSLLAGWIMLRLEGRPVRELGFPLDRSAPIWVAGGLALGVALALVGIGLIAVAGGVRWLPDTGGAREWLSTGGASLWMFGLPAAAEESMLRGYLLLVLSEVRGAGRALIITSVAFALLHLPNPGIGWLALVNICAAGLFLGALVLRTGNLWWATGAHLGWNWALAFLADLPVSGLEIVDTPAIEPVVSGPAWLSGGGFGPEGSALATVAVLAAAAWIWRGSRSFHDVSGSDPAHPSEGT